MQQIQVTTLFIFMLAAATAHADASSDFAALLEEAWEWQLDESPVFASRLGDRRVWPRSVFAEVDDRVVGGVYSLPDLNNPDSGHALLLSISLLEEARGRGLNLAMAAKSFLGMMDAGYRSTSYTIVLDENRPSRRTAEKLGFRPERNFVIYSRDLGS